MSGWLVNGVADVVGLLQQEIASVFVGQLYLDVVCSIPYSSAGDRSHLALYGPANYVK